MKSAVNRELRCARALDVVCSTACLIAAFLMPRPESDLAEVGSTRQKA
jgi:hypothetical protein